MSHTLPPHWSYDEVCHAQQHVLSLVKSYKILYDPPIHVCNLTEKIEVTWEQIAKTAKLTVPQCRYILRSKKGNLKKLYTKPQYRDADTGKFVVALVRGRGQIFILKHLYWIMPFMEWGRDADLKDIALQLHSLEHMKQECEEPSGDVGHFGFETSQEAQLPQDLMGGNQPYSQLRRRASHQYSMSAADENYEPDLQDQNYYDQPYGQNEGTYEDAQEGYDRFDNQEDRVVGEGSGMQDQAYSMPQNSKRMRIHDEGFDAPPNYAPTSSFGRSAPSVRASSRPRGRGRGGIQPGTRRGMPYEGPSGSSTRGHTSSVRRGGSNLSHNTSMSQINYHKQSPVDRNSPNVGPHSVFKASTSSGPSFDTIVTEELGSDSQRVLDVKNKLLSKTFVPQSKMDSFVMFLRQMIVDLDNPNLVDLAISRCAQVVADVYSFKFEIHTGKKAPNFDQERRSVDNNDKGQESDNDDNDDKDGECKPTSSKGSKDK